MNYKVCLIGAKLDSGNMGVSALTASLVKIILTVFQNADISLLIGNRSSKDQEIQTLSGKKIPIKVVNFRLSPKAKIREHLFWIFLLACVQKIIPFNSLKKKIIYSHPFLKIAYQADFIGDIRGGDSFSDIYGLNTLVIGSIPAIIVLLLGKKLVLLPQTYGPYNSTIGRCIAKFIIKRASYVFSRDHEGLDVIKKLTGRIKVKFCPDVAFTLEAIKPLDLHVEPPIPVENSPNIIGLNVNGLMYLEGYYRNNMFGLKMDYRDFVYKLALTILNKTNSHIIFIPHTFSPQFASDPVACIDVLKLLPSSYKNRIHFVTKEYDQSEIKGIIGLCDFFIGSRMHACIAAISQGIPTVGVAYSKKFKGVFDSVSAGDMIVDGRDVDTEEAVDMILRHFSNREDIKDFLREKVGAAQIQIIRAFDEMFCNTLMRNGQ